MFLKIRGSLNKNEIDNVWMEEEIRKKQKKAWTQTEVMKVILI